jgi:hypothetical protein
LVRALIGALNCCLHNSHTPTAGVVPSHLTTRRMRFAMNAFSHRVKRKEAALKRFVGHSGRLGVGLLESDSISRRSPATPRIVKNCQLLCHHRAGCRSEVSRVRATEEIWRRGSESNRRIKVLQTSPLPLGYRALRIKLAARQECVHSASPGT